jgi:hypothetical protein
MTLIAFKILLFFRIFLDDNMGDMVKIGCCGVVISSDLLPYEVFCIHGSWAKCLRRSQVLNL